LVEELRRGVVVRHDRRRVAAAFDELADAI